MVNIEKGGCKNIRSRVIEKSSGKNRRVTARKATQRTLHASRRISIAFSIVELSGPRPLRWGMGIVFRPRIWDHGALAFSFEVQPTSQTTAAGRVATPPTSTQLHASTVTSILGYPISLAYTMRKFSLLSNKPRLVAPFYDGYIYPYGQCRSL